VRLIQGLVLPGTWYFDVGANIGLMAVPFLSLVSDLRIASFEPSPNSLPWLRQTIRESEHQGRWLLIDKAVGPRPAKIRFSVSACVDSLYDGIQPTNRVPQVTSIEVEQTTLDAQWEMFGFPRVSVIKCDVEGGEIGVLLGAQELIKTCKPAVVFEWNAINLRAYDEPIDAILSIASDLRYRLYGAPNCIPIRSLTELRAHMALTETFLLLPEPA
jgi:FkbM family methyltransferase